MWLVYKKVRDIPYHNSIQNYDQEAHTESSFLLRQDLQYKHVFLHPSGSLISFTISDTAITGLSQTNVICSMTTAITPSDKWVVK